MSEVLINKLLVFSIAVGTALVLKGKGSSVNSAIHELSTKGQFAIYSGSCLGIWSNILHSRSFYHSLNLVQEDFR